jgi:VanZ family protein
MLRYVLPALVWTLTVTILTLLPGKDLPEVDIVNFDKFAHFGVFFLLCILFLRWKTFGPKLKASTFAIVLVIIAYGGIIELLQGAFYTDRFADIWDFTANGIGALSGGFIFPRISALLR